MHASLEGSVSVGVGLLLGAVGVGAMGQVCCRHWTRQGRDGPSSISAHPWSGHVRALHLMAYCTLRAHRLTCLAGGVPRWLQLPPLLLERIRVLTHMQVPEHLQHLQQQQQPPVQQEQAAPKDHEITGVPTGAGLRQVEQQQGDTAVLAADASDDEVMLIESSSDEEEAQEGRRRQQHLASQQQQQQHGSNRGQLANGYEENDDVIVISSDDEAEAGPGPQGGAGGLGSSGRQGQGAAGVGEAMLADGAAAGGTGAIRAAARVVGSGAAGTRVLQQLGTAAATPAAAAAAGRCGAGAASASDAGPAAGCSHGSGTGGRYVLYWMQVRVLPAMKCAQLGRLPMAAGHRGSHSRALLCAHKAGRHPGTSSRHTQRYRCTVQFDCLAGEPPPLTGCVLANKHKRSNAVSALRSRPSAGTRTQPWTPPAPPPPPCACRCAAPPSYCRTVTRTPRTAGSSSSWKVGRPVAMAGVSTAADTPMKHTEAHPVLPTQWRPVTIHVLLPCMLGNSPVALNCVSARTHRQSLNQSILFPPSSTPLDTSRPPWRPH